MTGKVDDYGRAMLPVALSAAAGGAVSTVEAWVDTGFTGQLMLPINLVHSLTLPLLGKATARLANGKTEEVDRFQCWIEWFGERKPVAALASLGAFPLLGIALLAGHVLTIDYERCTLGLNCPCRSCRRRCVRQREIGTRDRRG